jgi:hypothetical protein
MFIVVDTGGGGAPSSASRSMTSGAMFFLSFEIPPPRSLLGRRRRRPLCGGDIGAFNCEEGGDNPPTKLITSLDIIFSSLPFTYYCAIVWPLGRCDQKVPSPRDCFIFLFFSLLGEQIPT